jgi:hypothetical protein
MDFGSAHMRMSMSFPMPGFGSMQMDEIFDGNAFYIHFPSSLASRLPGGKAWMKVDLDALGKASGVDLKQMMQANQSNPADMLKALKGVGTSHLVGSEDIRGATTKHYRADIDVNKAADRIPDQQSRDAVKQMFSSSGLSSIPVDVWVDDSGRVRRESFSFSGAGMTMDMTIEFTRFGVAVDTTPPPSDQVIDAGALLGTGS